MPLFDLDLWPDEIAVDVRSPAALLHMQVDFLKRKTNGILEAEVVTAIVSKSFTAPLADPYAGTEMEKQPFKEHSLILKLPSLGHKECVVCVFHHDKRPYPVHFDEGGRVAHSQNEFVDLLRKQLQSKETVAMMQSMIARSNEARTV